MTLFFGRSTKLPWYRGFFPQFLFHLPAILPAFRPPWMRAPFYPPENHSAPLCCDPCTQTSLVSTQSKSKLQARITKLLLARQPVRANWYHLNLLLLGETPRRPTDNAKGVSSTASVSKIPT